MRNLRRKLKKEANRRLQPWQRLVRAGQYFERELNVRFQNESLRLKLYCQVLQTLDNNEIVVRCHSSENLEGDVGSMHRSTVQKIISAQEFELAREKGFV